MCPEAHHYTMRTTSMNHWYKVLCIHVFLFLLRPPNVAAEVQSHIFTHFFQSSVVQFLWVCVNFSPSCLTRETHDVFFSSCLSPSRFDWWIERWYFCLLGTSGHSSYRWLWKCSKGSDHFCLTSCISKERLSGFFFLLFRPFSVAP